MRRAKKSSSWYSARKAPLVVFVLMVSFAVFLAAWMGRHRWFVGAEWEFLANRDADEMATLFRPHDDHWSTIPILVYRALYEVAGLHTYLPYLFAVLASHVIVVVLLRLVMQRAGVDPWIATALAGAFAFFGAGWEGMIWGFQITFNGSIAFGLVHLVLSDHTGRIDRRDRWGVLAGAAGLMCSAIGLVFVAIVGLAVAMRRGRRVAAFHTVPLALIFSVWWVTAGSVSTGGSDVSETARFVVRGVSGAFAAWGQSTVFTIVFGGVTAAGLVIWLRTATSPTLRSERARREDAPSIALVVGAVLFLLASGARNAGSLGSGYAVSSRNLYVVAALALPAVALALDAVARTRSLAVPAVVLLCVAGVPGNVAELHHRRDVERASFADYRRILLTIPRLAVAREVPEESHPERRLADAVTMRFLVDEYATGAVPDVDADPATRASAHLHVVLTQQAGRAVGSATCSLAGDGSVRVDTGDLVLVGDVPLLVRHTMDGVRSLPKRIEPQRGRAVVVLAGPLDLEFEPVERGNVTTIDVCRSP